MQTQKKNNKQVLNLNRLIASLFVAMILTVFVTSCCNTKLVQCANGDPVMFPANESCALKSYDAYTREFSASFDINLNLLDTIALSIEDVHLRNQVIMLRQKYNQESGRLQEILKTSFLSIVRNPCQFGPAHYALLEQIDLTNRTISELEYQYRIAQSVQPDQDSLIRPSRSFNSHNSEPNNPGIVMMFDTVNRADSLINNWKHPQNSTTIHQPDRKSVV